MQKPNAVAINTRLLTCSAFVTKGGIPCDVGTDHAYLAAYLIDNDISKHVFACDIADGPLESARLTVTRLGFEDRITLVKSDGLDSVPNDGITDVIIAGMGGELISRIVLRADWLRRGVNLVLQPQTKASELRCDLYRNGFGIRAEKACHDGDFVYTVMNVVYTGEVKELSEVQAIVGGLDLSDSNAKDYIKTVANRMSTSAMGIQRSKNEAQREQAKKLDSLACELYKLIGEEDR